MSSYFLALPLSVARLWMKMERATRRGRENCMHSHFYALGQQVSYAGDGIAWPWKGGFEVTPGLGDEDLAISA